MMVFDARQQEAAVLGKLRATASEPGPELAAQVSTILEAVREEGDAALVRLERQLDWSGYTVEDIRVPEAQTNAAYDQVAPELLAALRRAIENVRAFHEQDKPRSWETEREGLSLGSRFTPVDSAGIYTPAGQAPLPSSLYMCAVPAAVAGVRRLAVCTPPRKDGSLDALTLVAARECGVDEVYRLGGAVAIAALAYGTATVHRVNKVVGPGNQWVIEAKRQVFGTVGIDSLAGPSESAIIADDSADPALVAADLLSQAEHAGDNMVILLSPSERLLDAVAAEAEKQATKLERTALISESLGKHGALALTRDLAQAASLASAIAPEHLQLAVEHPETLAAQVKHAGCIFLGHWATVPLGDYAAGPSHVLPTGGTARFSSPLSVVDFMKRTSLVGVSPEALERIGPDTIALAKAEGLTAHAAAVRRRLDLL
jgi:histidinol dehydrogenase